MLIREANLTDTAAIARIHVESWRTTYAGILPDDFLADLSVEGRKQMWQGVLGDKSNSRFVYVAETSEGEIIGFAAAGLERTGQIGYEAELYAIYLLQDYQRMGIGRMLFEVIVQQFLEAGFTTLLVWVLAENPACGFYAALGGRREYDKEIEIAGQVLQEYGFGWSDLWETFPQKES